MIRGERVLLRSRRESDVAVLCDGLYDDVLGHSRADSRPWVPTQPSKSPFTHALDDPAPDAAHFTVVEAVPVTPDAPDGERLVGEALLWGIDLHNRGAHLGLSLLPSARGRGLGTDVVRVLCEYGFAVRGLRRLEINTLYDNHAMVAAAHRCGFVREGLRRRSAWVYGEFLDELILGLLAEDWPPTRAGGTTGE
ncbi:GNAT family protein [Streptomyces sp. SL13]|uniref:GNAT family protein n=1 Tax=Streptantibioticus silvisoli TaxID=2705255 RepID=A0AA90HBR7_9ACTN|nr:GNAT family protein [Streptantibioticus silvisoli]MDI5966120.1 GNAT family protein [Streptantibioticus silvisoli]MDI5971917.1 GNAT family protein [Streptantibioticus silvisoli]